MPKNQIDITKTVMAKIKKEQIRIKPKWYFLLGSFAIFIALVGLVIFSIFLISLVSFSLRSHGPMAAIRYQQIITSFPWWAPILTIVALLSGIFLLRKYDFSYKKNFSLIIMFVVVGILIAGILIDILGFDNLWMKKGPMRRFYQQENNGYYRRNFK